MKYSDIIVPGGPTNTKAIEFIAENLKAKLIKLGLVKARQQLYGTPDNENLRSVINHTQIENAVWKYQEDEEDMKEVYLTFFIQKLKQIYPWKGQPDVLEICLPDLPDYLSSTTLLSGHILTIFTPEMLTPVTIEQIEQCIVSAKNQFEQIHLLTLTGNKELIDRLVNEYNQEHMGGLIFHSFCLRNYKDNNGFEVDSEMAYKIFKAN